VTAETSRRQARGDETRQAILDAARDVFVSDGYEGASIRKVAQAAGYTHGTIYLHFRDKDDLLSQLSEEQFRVLLERLRALPRSLDARARVAAALRQFVLYGLEFPNHYHLMFSIRLPHLAHGDERRFGPMAEQVYGFVYDSLSKAAARGVLAPADPHADTLALIAAVHGVIELHKSGVMDRRDAEATGERLVMLLLDGLAPASSHAARHDA
jgi:AcrR family transcriptional regulator